MDELLHNENDLAEDEHNLDASLWDGETQLRSAPPADAVAFTSSDMEMDMELAMANHEAPQLPVISDISYPPNGTPSSAFVQEVERGAGGIEMRRRQDSGISVSPHVLAWQPPMFNRRNTEAVTEPPSHGTEPTPQRTGHGSDINTSPRAHAQLPPMSQGHNFEGASKPPPLKSRHQRFSAEMLRKPEPPIMKTRHQRRSADMLRHFRRGQATTSPPKASHELPGDKVAQIERDHTPSPVHESNVFLDPHNHQEHRGAEECKGDNLRDVLTRLTEREQKRREISERAKCASCGADDGAGASSHGTRKDPLDIPQAVETEHSIDRSRDLAMPSILAYTNTMNAERGPREFQWGDEDLNGDGAEDGGLPITPLMSLRENGIIPIVVGDGGAKSARGVSVDMSPMTSESEFDGAEERSTTERRSTEDPDMDHDSMEETSELR